MDDFEPYYDEPFAYQRKRTSPAAKMFVVAGAGVLVFISGNLAMDVLKPDDSGLAPPIASLSPEHSAGTAPVAQPASIVPVLPMQTASTNSEANIGLGVPAPQTLNIQSLPSAAMEKPITSEPVKDTAEPEDASPEETANADQSASLEPDVIPADVTARKVGAFTRQWAGSPDKTTLRKYARTVSVLKQCGLVHIRTLKLYEGKNKPIYKQVDQRLAAKIARNKNSGSSSANVGAINPSDFTLAMSEGTHNPNLTSFARGQKLNTPIADDPYSEELGKETCKIIDAAVSDGQYDIKL